MLDNSKINLQGFTIIEILIVITIIGVLASITTLSYVNSGKKTITTSLQSDLSSNATALEQYRNFSDDGSYPSTTENLNSGAGLARTDGATLNYDYDSVSNTYCMDESKEDVSYYIISGMKQPAQGLCP